MQAKLWRARLETRRQEFADALELSVSAPFSLDLISHPGPGRNGQTLFNAGDIEPQAFSPDTATWFRNAIGPAMVVTQPDFEDHGAARSCGMTAHVAWARGIGMIEAPSQLCWAGPRRNLVMWIPDRRVALDD